MPDQDENAPRWLHRPLPGYVERIAFEGDFELRIVKRTSGSQWEIRFFSAEQPKTLSRLHHETQQLMPSDTPREEVQAVAIALWRMK